MPQWRWFREVYEEKYGLIAGITSGAITEAAIGMPGAAKERRGSLALQG